MSGVKPDLQRRRPTPLYFASRSDSRRLIARATGTTQPTPGQDSRSESQEERCQRVAVVHNGTRGPVGRHRHPAMNIAVIGPSGVGKGTHAASLGARFHLRHVATGDLLRHHLSTHSALGLLARRYIAQGELVPDEFVDAMIEEWCEKLPPDEGALFDGFPRTAYQAQFLDALLESRDRRLDVVLYLTAPDEEIVRRLSGRLICRNCQTPFHLTNHPPQAPGRCDRCGHELYQRPDDTPELVRARLRVFRRTTGPVLEHYAALNRLIILSGEGTLDEVDARLLATFEAVRAGTMKFASAQEAAAIEGVGRLARPTAALARPAVGFVLLGGPGSGKGTQAERLSVECRLPHIATGDLFRENLRQATPLGQLAKTYMDRGELVPDDVTEAMVEERLARPDAAKGFILDGFPRTLPQAHALMEMLARLERRLAAVIYIKVTDDAIVSRLSARQICRQCQAPYHMQFKPPRQAGICDACGGPLYQRADDNPTTVRARLATFHGQTEPLIEYYREAGLLHTIDGEGEVAQVCARSLASVRHFGVPAGDAPPSVSDR
jgi:adenylate kinase